jgi:hypothetical protein
LLKTFQPISNLLILRGGARAAGSADGRARQFGRTGDSDPGKRRLTLSPLASKRSPAPRRQDARHSVATKNVATEWAHSPCPFTTALAGALAGALAEERGRCCIGFRKRFSKRGKVARGNSRTGVFTRAYPRNAATCRSYTSGAQSHCQGQSLPGRMPKNSIFLYPLPCNPRK